jgi:hypothetical protein
MRKGTTAVLMLAMSLAFTACGTPIAGPTESPAGSPTAPPTATVAPTPAKTATPAPTSTLAPNTTPTPAPPPLLPLEALDYFVVGMSPGTPWMLHFLTEGTGDTTDFVLPDGRTVHFDVAEDSGPLGPYVTSYRIGNAAPVVAVPDTVSIRDGRISADGRTLEVWQVVSLSDLVAALGTPAGDATVDTETYDPRTNYVQIHERTLTYPGVTLVLDQERAAADKSLWHIHRIQFTASSYSTPRGLEVGMTPKEVLKRYGTGAFIIEERGSPDGIQAMTLTKGTGSVSGSVQDDLACIEIHLEFMNGKVVRIGLSFWHGP